MQRLVIACAKVGPSAIDCASACASVSSASGLAQLVVEAPAFGFGAVHRAAGVEQLGGAARADDARQNVARAHVGAGEPDPHEQERHLAARRCRTQVRGHRDDGAGAGAHAVDRGDDRLRAGAHRLDQVAGHARECEQARHVAVALHLDQWPDDLVHVAARAEIAARAGDHHGLDVIGVGEVAERVAQLGVGFERQRVLSLRPVERDGRDLAVKLPEKMARLRRSVKSMPCGRNRCAVSSTVPVPSLVGEPDCCVGDMFASFLSRRRCRMAKRWSGADAPARSCLVQQRVDLADQARNVDRLGVEVVAAGGARLCSRLRAMAWAVSAITGIVCVAGLALTCRVASQPSITGRLMSIRMIAGLFPTPPWRPPARHRPP